MSNEYKSGFDDGYKFAVENFDANTGRYKVDLPDKFIHRGNTWSCGYGEGLISGRRRVMIQTFGNFTEISYASGKAKVEY